MNISISAAAIALAMLGIFTPLGHSQDDATNIVEICDGATQDVCGQRPNPLPGFGGWTGGPRGYEEDDSYNDDMGPATTTIPGPPPTACINIRNSGGQLSGPMGGVQNGWFEGDCIEVVICWPYSRTYEKKVPCAVYGQSPGIGWCWIQVTETWQACSPAVVVCPCDESDG